MTSYRVVVPIDADPAWDLPIALQALRPAATQCLSRLNAFVWADQDPQLLELARLRIAWLLGVATPTRSDLAVRAGLTEDRVADLPSYPTSPRFTALERATLELAEQLVIDVSAVSSDLLDDLCRSIGPDNLRAVVTSLWTVEFTLRLQIIAARLLPQGWSPRRVTMPTVTAAASVTVGGLLDAYQAAVVRGDALDAVTTELVRLRCARTHHCRICQTLRLAAARADGVDEAMTSKIDQFESSDLPERIKVALRITDALIVRPEELTDAVVTQARDLFSPDELAELCLDITKWSTQKIHVALGLDGADRLDTNDSGVALFGFRDDGTVAGYWT